MNKQKISKGEVKKDFRQLVEKKIGEIISHGANLFVKEDIQVLWSYLKALEGDEDYSEYFDLYAGISDYVANSDLIGAEELASLFNRVVYLENSKKTAN